MPTRKPDPLDFRADLVRRLRCAEGHLHGIAAMVERGDECERLIRQLLAVQGALREINRLLLKHHLEVCLHEQLQGPDIAIREKCLDEVVSLYVLIFGGQFIRAVRGGLPPRELREG